MASFPEHDALQYMRTTQILTTLIDLLAAHEVRSQIDNLVYETYRIVDRMDDVDQKRAAAKREREQAEARAQFAQQTGQQAQARPDAPEPAPMPAPEENQARSFRRCGDPECDACAAVERMEKQRKTLRPLRDILPLEYRNRIDRAIEQALIGGHPDALRAEMLLVLDELLPREEKRGPNAL